MASQPENFDIRILPNGEPPKYRLLVQYPGVQPESGRFIECELPPNYEELFQSSSPDRQRRWRKSPADLVKEENLACQAANLDAVKEIGDRLFQTVLQGELAGEFGVVADRVAREGGRLRLRVDLTNAPELSREPWEALYRKRSETLLAIHAATPIVRLLESQTPADANPVEPPVRLLVVTAVPGGDLNVAAELANIEKRTERLAAAERSVPFEVRLLKAADRSTMYEAVRTFRPHFLHYIGHGSFKEGSGWIHLHGMNDPAEVDPIDAETLRDMLANERPKLVVLNTCEGGMASDIDPFSGMAHALIQRNIPYVVAMQYPISDEAAIAFSDVLYADLADSKPIDIAVTNARNAIRLLKDPAAQVELITPVLYTSGSIDRLIDPAIAEPAWDEEAPRAAPKVTRRRRWLIAAGFGGLVLIGLTVSASLTISEDIFNEVGDELGNPSATENPDAAENAMAEDAVPDHAAMDSNASGDVAHEIGSEDLGPAYNEPALRPRQTAPRRARRSAQDSLPSIVQNQPRAPRRAVVAPAGPVTGATRGYHAGDQPETARPAVTPPRLGAMRSFSLALGMIMVDAYRFGRGAPTMRSAVRAAETLGQTGAVTFTPIEVGDSLWTSGVWNLAGLRVTSDDPDIIFNITGRGGGNFAGRFALGRQLAAGLLQELPASSVQVDAVADGRSPAAMPNSSPLAEFSLRLTGAAQVHFDFDSDMVAAADLPALEHLASWLGRNPKAGVVLRAHSDARGPEAYNFKLAERRAEAVRNKLVEFGIPESGIDEVVIGEGMPAAGTTTTFADDRRVELLILPPPQSTVEQQLPE